MSVYSTIHDEYIREYYEKGVNVYIRTHSEVKEELNNIVDNTTILRNIVDFFIEKFTTKDSQTFKIFHKDFYKYLSKQLINKEISIRQTKICHEIFEFDQDEEGNELITNVINLDCIPNNLIKGFFQFYIGNITEILNKLNTKILFKQISGHFIESIITGEKKIDFITTLDTCRQYDRLNQNWNYSKKDYARIIDEIVDIIKRFSHEMDPWLDNFVMAIPHVYIDNKLSHANIENNEELYQELRDYYDTIKNNVKDYSEFENSLKNIVKGVVMDATHENKFEFKSNIIHVDPMKYEVDMLVNGNTLVELKTGLSGVQKQMRKLIFETKFNKCYNVVYINLKSWSICYNTVKIEY